MKTFFIVCVAVSAVVAYDSKHDDLDIDGVLADPKLLQNFLDCFLGRIPCDPVAAQFLKDLPEAVAEVCSKCTPKQKHIFRVFMTGLKQKSPQEFEAFKAKFDPENKYFPAIEKAFSAY